VTTRRGMGHVETAEYIENTLQLAGVQTVGSVATQLNRGR